MTAYILSFIEPVAYLVALPVTLVWVVRIRRKADRLYFEEK